MKSAVQTIEPENQSFTQGAYERVMLIDDNTMDNFINKRLIETCGFAKEVICCESAAMAISYLEKNQQMPSLLFLDINMPEMNGFEFLEVFEKMPASIHSQCKVLMLSTSESFKDLNRANKNRFVRKFLNKPLTVDVLKAIKV